MQMQVSELNQMQMQMFEMIQIQMQVFGVTEMQTQVSEMNQMQMFLLLKNATKCIPVYVNFIKHSYVNFITK